MSETLCQVGGNSVKIEVDYQRGQVSCLYAGRDGSCTRVVPFTLYSGEYPENPTREQRCNIAQQKGYRLVLPEIVGLRLASEPAVKHEPITVVLQRDFTIPTY